MSAPRIVDASVALKWLILEEGSDLATAMVASGTRLLAPKLISLEVANALWKKMRQNTLSAAGAQERLSSLPRYFEALLDHEDLVGPALALSRAYDHPVYDFVYLEAARRHDAQLLTADDRFLRKLAGTPEGARLLRLADWRSE